MLIKYLDNEEGYRNNDDNNLFFVDIWYERGKKVKKKKILCYGDFYVYV